MTKYELILLLPEEVNIKSIEEAVKSLSGKIASQDLWGKKELAYPIKKKKSAYFFDLMLDFDRTKVLEFRRKLNFNDQIMRYLLLKVE